MGSKTLFAATAAMMVLALAETFFVDFHHSIYWWHSTIGFDIVFGLLGCLLLIIVAKGLGHLFISKNPDFYDRGDNRNDF